MGNNSSSSVNGLVGLGMTGTGAGAVNGVMGTPQTGASKMAAAAKRGQAGGVVDGLPPVGVDGAEEDHPLSESSLAARCAESRPVESVKSAHVKGIPHDTYPEPPVPPANPLESPSAARPGRIRIGHLRAGLAVERAGSCQVHHQGV